MTNINYQSLRMRSWNKAVACISCHILRNYFLHTCHRKQRYVSKMFWRLASCNKGSFKTRGISYVSLTFRASITDSKVHRANMGPQVGPKSATWTLLSGNLLPLRITKCDDIVIRLTSVFCSIFCLIGELLAVTWWQDLHVPRQRNCRGMSKILAAITLLECESLQNLNYGGNPLMKWTPYLLWLQKLERDNG